MSCLFPENPYLGQKSLIDLIYSGIEDGKFQVSAYDRKNSDSSNSTLSLQEVKELMGESLENIQFQTMDGGFLDSTILRYFISSEVKKYIMKEAEFYDDKGKLVGSEIINLVPVREYFREDLDSTVLQPLFSVPFNNRGFKELLTQNSPFRFSSQDNLSYYSFFKKMKYRVESREIFPVSVSNAMKELEIQKVKTFQ